ncbi:polysaccharide deacetylase [Thermococcus siculi]|uniref:Polysaccharide deacetylase n=1 Tax=Thermococcus siculi TaxID=72803 RepID=A0A2Z2MJU4_9EURY|nr:DUF2334 domain-containing protein [Thermococcus siculi]ASJ08679.1 polysaccharide deacetylase [Thermococcus siculi]
MGNRRLAAFLLIVALLVAVTGSVAQFENGRNPGVNPQPREVSNHLRKSTPPRKSEEVHYEKPTILVHDVTPFYFDELREIIAVLDDYNYSNSTILFVIPVFDTTHYGDEWDLRKHPDFVEYLHELQERGYRVELHGYAHTYHEFNCSHELANEKLDNATAMMRELGFDNITLFLPPAWAINNESLRVILEHNFTVVMTDYLILPNGSRVRIVNKEYSWYINGSQVRDRLRVALHDYRKASKEGIPFYLSVHPGPVNYGGGLEFLREFLEAVDNLMES